MKFCIFNTIVYYTQYVAMPYHVLYNITHKSLDTLRNVIRNAGLIFLTLVNFYLINSFV